MKTKQKSQQKSTKCEYYTQKCFSHFVFFFFFFFLKTRNSKAIVPIDMVPALASARMRASLSRCVITRGMWVPDSREEGSIWESTWPKTQCTDTACVLPVALSSVASSLVEPRLRIRECLTPRVYVALKSSAISHVV